MRRATLLGPNPRGKQSFTDTEFDPLGLIAVRYSYAAPPATEGEPRAGSANIDVAWFDAKAERAFHGKIAQVAFAELPHYYGDGAVPTPHQTTAIGEGGLVLHAYGGRGAWLIRQSGTAEPIAWSAPDRTEPFPTWWQEALLNGDEITVFHVDPGQLGVSRSARPWAHWNSVRWPWPESVGILTILRTVNQAAALDSNHWLFPIDAKSPDPSHAPVRVHPAPATGRYEACSTKELDVPVLRIEASDTKKQQVPVIRLPDRELDTSRVGLRISPDGSACVSSVLAAEHGGDWQGILLAPHAPERAWMIVPDDKSMTVSLRRARCRKVAEQ
jgi:hypothetical protein